MIMRCTCKSDSRGNTAGAEFQDLKYGRGNRVFNIGGAAKEKPKYTCTVCGQEKLITFSRPEVTEDTKEKK